MTDDLILWAALTALVGAGGTLIWLLAGRRFSIVYIVCFTILISIDIWLSIDLSDATQAIIVHHPAP